VTSHKKKRPFTSRGRDISQALEGAKKRERSKKPRKLEAKSKEPKLRSKDSKITANSGQKKFKKILNQRAK